MYKWVLMLMAVVSGSAAAEWVAITGNERLTIYVDPTTIRRDGDKVKMWSLFDYRKAQTVKVGGKSLVYLSTKGQDEFDCKEEQKRLIFLTGHSKKMGHGNTVSTENGPSPWEPVAPASIAEVMWKFACAQR